MDEYTKQALRLLGTYTAGSFDIWALAGDAKASCRAHILTVFTGKQVPQRYAGINALRDTFYKAMDITGETPNDREKQFVELAKTETERVLGRPLNYAKLP